MKDLEQELQEIKNKMKNCNGVFDYYLEYGEVDLLLSYIEQLEKELQNYKDLDISNMETIDCQELEIVNRENEITKLENNRDKAIEVINTQLKNAEGGLKDNLRIIKFNLIKGSCTFEDLNTEEDYKYILKGGSDE